MKHLWVFLIAILTLTPQIIFAQKPEIEFIGKLNWYLWEQSRIPNLDPVEKARIEAMRKVTGGLLQDLVKEKSVRGTLPEILKQEEVHLAQQAKAQVEARKLMTLYKDKIKLSSQPLLESNQPLKPKQGIFAKIGNLFKPKLPPTPPTKSTGFGGVMQLVPVTDIVSGSIKMGMGSQEQMLNNLEERNTAIEARMKIITQENSIDIFDNVAEKNTLRKELIKNKIRAENLRNAVNEKAHQEKFQTY